MSTFHAVAPVHNVDLALGLNVEFGGGLRLTALPPWVQKQGLLDAFSRRDREAVREAKQAFIITYEAGALGEADPNWNGAYPRPIQETKYDLCLLGNLALWLSRPSPVCLSVCIHAPEFDVEPVAQQIEGFPTALCHPQDVPARVTTSDLALAQRLHMGLVAISRTSAIFTAIRATLAGLQMNLEAVRYALFWMALEALFGPEDAREITFRLSQRVAFFLAGTRSDAKKLFVTCKKGYALRSKIVHGRWNEIPDSTSRMADAETLVRRSLARLLEERDLAETFSGTARETFLDELVFRESGGAV
jgi:hypothetical protein